MQDAERTKLLLAAAATLRSTHGIFFTACLLRENKVPIDAIAKALSIKLTSPDASRPLLEHYAPEAAPPTR